MFAKFKVAGVEKSYAPQFVMTFEKDPNSNGTMIGFTHGHSVVVDDTVRTVRYQLKKALTERAMANAVVAPSEEAA